MPQQRQEKELLALNQEKRKLAIPGENASLSLKSMTQQGGYPQIKKLLKILQWGYCLWLTQMARAGQLQHFHPCCPGGWVRPTMASDHPTASHVWYFRVPSFSCQLLLTVPWPKTFSGFSCLPFPEPFQLSTTALILSIFPPSGPCFLEEISLFLSFQAEITGEFCSAGDDNLAAGGQEGEVVQKVR